MLIASPSLPVRRGLKYVKFEHCASFKCNIFLVRILGQYIHLTIPMIFFHWGVHSVYAHLPFKPQLCRGLGGGGNWDLPKNGPGRNIQASQSLSKGEVRGTLACPRRVLSAGEAYPLGPPACKYVINFHFSPPLHFSFIYLFLLFHSSISFIYTHQKLKWHSRISFYGQYHSTEQLMASSVLQWISSYSQHNIFTWSTSITQHNHIII
jgi:hypothetical protein